MAGQSAASSLYSGIFDRSKSDESKKESNDGNQSITNPIVSGTEEKPIDDKSQAWSAALRFTPRRNVNVSKPKRTLVQAHLSTAFSNSDIHSDPVVDKNDKVEPSSSVVKSPQENRETDKGQSTSSLHPIAKHGIQTHAINIHSEDSLKRPLPIVVEPPPLALSAEDIENDRTLFRNRALRRGEISNQPFERWEYGEDAYDEEEDVNGFANTIEGKKAKKRKRKRRSSPGRHGGLTASMNMDADYDPRIPNDFNDFNNLLIRRREEERKNRKSNETKYGELDGTNSDDEGTTRNRYDRSGKFAPPAAYRGPSHTNFNPDFPRRKRYELSRSENDDEDDKPYLSPPPPGPPPVMPATVVKGEDAYQHRAAMSQAMTGEEAYQRRLAMSQRSNSENDTLKADDLASRTAAAAAIAAKLAKIAPTQDPDSDSADNLINSSSIHDPSTFAERLMMKQGWKKGEAIGAEGNKGIIDPILAQKVEIERAKHANGNVEDRSVRSSGSSNRGTIISIQDQQRRAEERQKYGEASEVILLENMVMNDDDIDDDLPGEIGEECEKYGKVERVFIWPAAHANVVKKSSSNTLLHSTISAKPRIFVRFNGITSAWKCLKEMDGRFFAGNTVRVRYYPLQDFNRGNYDRLYE